MTLVESIAQAIARQEGFYKPGSISQRQNNPGNLRSWGSYPVVNGYVQFSDVATGWNALRVQVQKNIDRGLSLQEFFAGQRDANGNIIPGGYPGYSPSADANNPALYAQNVARQTGIDSTVPLNTLGGPPGNPTKPPKAKS